MKHDLIVFCDFDGTVTEKETLEEFMTNMTGVDIKAMAQEMMGNGAAIKTVVTKAMAMIPSDEYKKAAAAFGKLQLRQGFAEFLDRCYDSGIPVVVLSGGITEMNKAALADHIGKIADIWGGVVDTSGEYIRFWSDYETETELVGKIGIMKGYDYKRAVCIGDSYTDFEMACYADIVFARDRLAAKLEDLGKNYYRFETFYDIIEVFESAGILSGETH